MPYIGAMQQSLFDAEGGKEALAPGATLLRGFARKRDVALLAAIEEIAAHAPFRHMVTPGGFEMSVAMTNGGAAGWVTDPGYRYQAHDPQSGAPWPAMPAGFLALADEAATAAGFANFVPDACLINRYEPGAKLSLHQDKDEADYAHPIVSVSLGLPPLSSSVDRSAPIPSGSSRWSMATWSSGAARRGCSITAC